MSDRKRCRILKQEAKAKHQWHCWNHDAVFCQTTCARGRHQHTYSVDVRNYGQETPEDHNEWYNGQKCRGRNSHGIFINKMAVIYRIALTLWVTRLGCCELYEVISEIQRKAHLFPSNFYEKKRELPTRGNPLNYLFFFWWSRITSCIKTLP